MCTRTSAARIIEPSFCIVATAMLATLQVWDSVAIAQDRALGLDISAWQGSISQATWNNIYNVENREFVFIRSSRGGTTGFYNQSNPNNDNPPGQNTLSQRYDDPYFVQNITRATNAGMLAGPYHFGRMDIVEGTPYAGGIANTGTDEANHFLQMAGAWMRPGYLLPVFDFEAGNGIRTPEELAQFAIDFSDRIYAVMGIRPAVYIGNNYASPMESIPSSEEVVAAYPTLWTARWPNQSNPDAIPVNTADPGDYTSTVYGPWDNPPNPADPWHFWQYASTGRLQSYNNGNSNLDFDVAHGGIEYVKDHLVPAVWMNDSSGEWTTLMNWNSGQAPTAPVTGPGQVPPAATGPLPTPRLPGVDDAATSVNGQNDTVILDRPNADITVTLASGAHDIRKLYVRERLNIRGGSLTVNYTPTSDSTPISAQFSEAVTLSGAASLSVHTLQVDAQRTFTLGGGTLSFNTINLMPHDTTPAKIAVEADMNLNPLANAEATIARGAGPGNTGSVDLGGGNRTFTVGDGAADVDLSVDVAIRNGGLTKTGAGTLALNGANSLLHDTTVATGTLSVRRRLFSNSATVDVANGASLDLNFNGGPDTVRALHIGGVAQAAGTWGAVGSGAQFESPAIIGTGTLYVDPAAPPDSNVGYVLDDFEVDEGHFSWPYDYSPPSQTFGLTASTMIDRVTTDHQGEGVGSQRLNLVSTGGSWQLRHNSGIGAGLAAKPAGNVPLEAIGYVGFWLKTDDAGITVRLAIDDPVGGNTALERGAALDVIADNQWHLYQWDLEDEYQWEAFAGGANGVIDAEFGTVTIDSIWFAGAGDAEIFLDTISYNPDAMLAAAPVPGDFNGDGVVNFDDYSTWSSSYGQVSSLADGNGNNNGTVDAADYVVWRKIMSMAGSGSSALADSPAVPEPSGLVLLAVAGFLLGIGSRRTS
jgi:autotransporter-associated beta strand protein